MRALRSAVLAAVAVLGAAVLAFSASVGNGLHLLAGTILIMGGNDNSAGDGMEQILDGYFDETAPDYAFPGYRLDKVPWLADISDHGYEESQADGLAQIDEAIAATLAGRPGEKVVAVGYSSSANVMIRQIRRLDSRGSPDSDRLSFIVIGSPNRPNGGLIARFGRLLPLLTGTSVDAPNHETPYDLTDVSWEYDPISDFPTYPLNLLATANAVAGFFELHGDYRPADLSDPIADQTAPDGTRYVLLRAPNLPLLQPLYRAGVPARLLQAAEPALKVLIDLGYDRTIPPGVPTRARLGPPPAAVLRALPDLGAAVAEGLSRLTRERSPSRAASDDSATRSASDDEPADDELESASVKPVTERDATRDRLTKDKPAPRSPSKPVTSRPDRDEEPSSTSDTDTDTDTDTEKADDTDTDDTDADDTDDSDADDSTDEAAA